MNETVDGPYLIATGEEDLSDFGRVLRWLGQDKVIGEPWGSPPCNAINGTDGTLFPPFMDEDEPLYVFVTDLFR